MKAAMNATTVPTVVTELTILTVPTVFSALTVRLWA